jgi:arabinan endo-1,5-alpha-L-arabinosidase
LTRIALTLPTCLGVLLIWGTACNSGNGSAPRDAGGAATGGLGSGGRASSSGTGGASTLSGTGGGADSSTGRAGAPGSGGAAMVDPAGGHGGGVDAPAATGGAAGGRGTAGGGGSGGNGNGNAVGGGPGGASGVASPILKSLSCGQSFNYLAMGDTWTHDPTLTREGNTYYLYFTGLHVPFKSSTDGITWTNGGNVFPANLSWWGADVPVPDNWAPDIHKIKGTYYVYYSVSAWNNFNSSVGLVTNTVLDPASPDYRWVDRGKVIDFRNGGAGVNVIDPDLFVDDDGTSWLVYGSYRTGIRLVQLDPLTGKLLKDPPDLVVLTNALGEGADIIKHNGYYYLVVSRGICCAQLASTYQVVMGRSRTLKGPYLTRDNQRLLDGSYTLLLAGDTNHPGQGGQSFYEESGQLFMVYHAYTAPTGDPLVNVRPIFFDSTDWPTLDPCLAAGR